MRATTTVIFLLLSIPLWGQNWITLSPDLYPAGKMAEEGVEMVNIYEVVQENAGEEKEKGHLVRVVRSPVRSYTFDRKGNITEHIEYNEETGQVRMRVESVYGEHGIAAKESRVYVTRESARVSVKDSLNRGMKLAMHRRFFYHYGENGHLSSRAIKEIGNGRVIPADSATFEFSTEGKLLRQDKRLLAHSSQETSIFKHGEDGKVEISRSNGNHALVSLDEQGRFSSIVEYTDFDSHPQSEAFYYYQGVELDSSWTSYRAPEQSPDRTIGMGSRYFYDKSGKLVMIRQHLPGGRILETLHEYFYFHEHE